ncbi:MAG TPA: hypothetical protein PKW54_02695 [Ferruginibacter sp.]|nr:hypothetical protein [Ferruginibacter sp.]
MRKSALSICILVFFCITCKLEAQQFGGNDPSLKWLEMRSSRGRIVYPSGLDSQASRMASLMQRMEALSATDTLYKPARPWTFILQNQTTIPNAYVRMAPVMSELYMTPVRDNFSLGSLRWDDNLIIHEYRHVQQFSRFNKGLTRVFSFLLGEEGQLLANGITIPDYYFEGDAVWQETRWSWQGRGRLPGFYNNIRAAWSSGKPYRWMQIRSGSLQRLLPDHYELGYILTAYGHQKYGPAFWDKVTNDAVRFKGLFYAFNKAIERHSGVSYKRFREEALRSFREQLGQAKETSAQAFRFIHEPGKKVITDDLFPQLSGTDSLIVTRRSYQQASGIYLLTAAGAKKLRVKDQLTDEYMASRGNLVVYSAYQWDPRWYNRDYSEIRMYNLQTNKQRRLTKKTKYFSPDISPDGLEILAVHADPNGKSYLHRLQSSDGKLLAALPNPHGYYFTQTRYWKQHKAVSAIRNQNGRMALAEIDVKDGSIRLLSPWTTRVIGYPMPSGNKVFFNMQDDWSDQVFVYNETGKEISRCSRMANSLYYPHSLGGDSLVASLFTSNGQRLIKFQSLNETLEAGFWDEERPSAFANWQPLASASETLTDSIQVTPFAGNQFHQSRKSINFHSRRPLLEDPEWGYSWYTDHFFSQMSGELNYRYNRVERSHTFGANLQYARWYPVLFTGAELSLNRQIDTAFGKTQVFNSAKWNLGAALPLRWAHGQYIHQLTASVTFNQEQLYNRGIGKNIFQNDAFSYLGMGLNMYRANRQARQHIFPRWAQSVSALFRQSTGADNRFKLTINSSWYFPGAFPNHHLVLQGSYQRRDSLPDIYSNSFSYARGYDALTTRRMYKWGVNYHFPLFYPDWGFGNILFCQRVRLNLFYDHVSARARLNGLLTDIINRSAGAEIYFDNKIWNALPVSIGVRYARLLDDNLRNRSVRNRWELVLPVNLIP